MGCKIVHRHGKLCLRLTWHPWRTQESMGVAATPRNRQILERDFATPIAAEMRAGRFTPERYLDWFPRGSRAQAFREELGLDVAHVPEPSPEPTVGGYYREWIDNQKPPLVRRSRERDYRQHFTCYILPEFGPTRMTDLRTKHLIDFRTELVIARKLSVKTARNIIDSSFRALYSAARQAEMVDRDIFGALVWPRLVLRPPDPFTIEERDRIVGWFAERRPEYYAFVATLFHVGVRPSEATGLRWGDVDLGRNTITISRSRYLGQESATKTAHSARTIPVVSLVGETLRGMKPLHADAGTYVFVNAQHGGPINHSEWPKYHWRMALRSLEIRPRKFYATRHTFISIMASRGANLKGLAEYCGTSVVMIERDYARFMPADPYEFVRLAEQGQPAKRRRR